VNKIYFNKLVFIVLSLPICTLPFGFSKLFVQPQTGQSLLFLSLISFILFVGVYYLIFQQNKSKKQYRNDILLLSFIVFGIANSILLKKEFGQYKEYFWELTGLLILYIIVRNSKSNIISILFFGFIIAGFLQSIYGIFQLVDIFPSNHRQFPVTGSFNNPGPYAGYLASALPFSIVFLWFTQSEKRYSSTYIVHNVTPKYFFKKTIHSNKRTTVFVAILLITISIVFMIIAAKSRAALLAIIVSMLYLFFQFYKLPLNEKKRHWKIQIGKSNFKSKGFQFLFSIFLIVIVGLASIGLYQMKKDSADGRLLIWNVTSKMIQDTPLFGHGTNGFQANYMEYQADFFEANPTSHFASLADNNIYAFNEFLRIASEHGLAGLIIVLVILYFLFFGNFKNDLNRNEILLLISAKAGLISILVFSLFSYPLEILPIKLNLVIFIAIIASFQKSIFKFQQNNFSINIWGRRIVGVILMGLSILLISNISGTYKAQRNWKLGYTTYKLGAYKHSLKYLENALPNLNNNGEFLIQYAKALSLSGENKMTITQLERAKKYLPNSIVYTTLGDSYRNLGEFYLAEKSYIKAILMVPSRFYPKYLLAKLYIENGEYKKAREIAKELLKKKIKVESMAILEIKKEMKELIENLEKAQQQGNPQKVYQNE